MTAMDRRPDEAEIKLPSERVFGLSVGTVLLSIAVVSAAMQGRVSAALVALGTVGAALAATALVAPRSLARLNRGWFALGTMLHRIMTPVILVGIYFLVVTPLGLVMRLAGARPLKLRFDRRAPTYWVARAAGSGVRDMKDQF